MKYTEFDKQMVLKFLERNYPVSRVKHNMRFKRAITLDNGLTFFLSEKNSHIRLKLQLVEHLRVIFSYDENFLKEMVVEFLPFK
jgi:hypothetical protein